MKLLRIFSLFILLSAPFAVKAQSCFGDYTWYMNGSTVNFNGTVSLNVTNIIWDFGDGNFDYTNAISPSHTYAAAGNYTACIIVYDSLQSCSDSSCHTIVIDSCYGAFTYTVNGLTAIFSGYGNGATSNAVYVWNFGDNSPADYAQNPSHTFANAGTYTVCFAYYDLTTGCADSICMPVTVGSCNADFTWVDSLGYVFFVSSSSLGNGGYYVWDFGDGGYSTQQYPSHNYLSPGTYQVCLTVYDSAQNFCDSTCHILNVTNVAGVNDGKINIGGITLSPNPADQNVNLSFYLTESANIQISVYDIAGRIVEKPTTQNFNSGKCGTIIDTQSYMPGTYFIQLIVNGQSVNSRLMITHKQ
ncbi:hypothetical protein BH09BAC5_BH09BAC5_02700 [soil metagenome]